MSAALDPPGFMALTGVSRETAARLDAYAGLLRRWSARVNLVGRNTFGDLWRRHFLDLAQLLPLLPEGACSLLDLGSGAGFPGLVLAILEVAGVELAEADERKCAFLREAVRITGAAAVVHHGRIEALPARAYDVVTARACAPLARLLPLAEPFIGANTVCLFLKGERADEELAAAARDGWRVAAIRRRSVADPGGAILSLRRVTRAHAAA